MDLNGEFDRRIAAIHGLDHMGLGAPISTKETAMDVRQAELHAMTDVYLGATYDLAKRNRIEELQIDLHRKQTELAHRLQAGLVNTNELRKAANDLIEETFVKCEEVLGAEDFCKLFGASRAEIVELFEGQAFFGAAPEVPTIIDQAPGLGHYS
jgi:hypothetical protein